MKALPSTCEREPLGRVHMHVVPIGDVLVVYNFCRHARVRVRAPQVLQELFQKRLRKAVNDCAAQQVTSAQQRAFYRTHHTRSAARKSVPSAQALRAQADWDSWS